MMFCVMILYNDVPCLFSGSVSSTSKPSDDNPTYVYDHRGLKVRKDSLTKQTEDDEAEEERDKSRQSTVGSASSPRCLYLSV